ncbi:MAG: beta-lactamase family protein [Microthrixaceae bacterium]|nr:beta-lactamase family protein [Microthrixaceae bacterium]
MGTKRSTRRPIRTGRVALVGVMVAAASACQPYIVMSTATEQAINRPVAGTDRVEAACDLPAAGDRFARATPESVGIDPKILDWALEATRNALTASVQVYRHNCLVATAGPEGANPNQQFQLFSMTKSVVALGVGRAVTLGLVDVDDPIGNYLDGLDAAHGALTLRQLMTQSSGLRFGWANDLAGSVENSLDQALTMPISHAPGTDFEYAQTTVNVVAAVVASAAGVDFQEFMDRELLSPIGISRSRWQWWRDAVGNTQGYAWLTMTSGDVARLASLVLHQGAWEGRQLIDPAYIAAMSAPSATNPGYGYLVQVNSGDWWIESFGGRRYEGPRLTSAPADTVMFSGFLDQDVFIVPSLDLVISRNGLPMESRWRWRLFNRLMPAFPEVSAVDPAAPMPRSTDIHIDWEQIADVETLLRRLSTNGGAVPVADAVGSNVPRVLSDTGLTR